MPSMAGGCAQAMSAAARDEDERSGWADVFLAVERHDVLALQHIERLGAIVVHMDRRPEAWWFFSFEDGDHTRRLFGACLHRHPELAEADDPPPSWPDDESLGVLGHRASLSGC